MATRTPLVMIPGTSLTTALDTSYTVPANSVATVTAVTVNNTTASARTVTLQIGGRDICTDMSVPAKSSATIPGAVAHHLTSGQSITAKCDAASAVNLFVSGYLQQ